MIKILQTIGRIDAISPRQRKKFIWKICDLTKFSDTAFEINFFGLKYTGHTKNLIDRYVYFLGAYEKGMLNFIQKSLENSKNKVFLDIGANVGHHSLFASKYASQVFSFEPYEKVRKALEEKVRINNLKNVTVVPYALGSANEELTFFEPADFNTGTGSFIQDFKPTNENKGLKLIVRNGSELFSELGVKNIGLIKLDVEGFEALVLKGILPILASERPVIIMEYSKESQKLFEDNPVVKDFLRSHYSMKIFNNPNKTNFQLNIWDFNKFGDVVFTPKP